MIVKFTFLFIELLLFFFFFRHTHGMWKFLGQGLNPCGENTRSLTHCTTRGLRTRLFNALSLITSAKPL